MYTLSPHANSIHGIRSCPYFLRGSNKLAVHSDTNHQKVVDTEIAENGKEPLDHMHSTVQYLEKRVIPRVPVCMMTRTKRAAAGRGEKPVII